jgi:hypothetical protein
MNARERLQVMIRTNPSDMTVWSAPEVRDALDAYRDEALAEQREKSSPTGADATPGPAGRVAQLLDAIRTQRGEWTTRKVQQVYRAGGSTEPLRATARTDLRILHAMGHLVQHETGGRRFYTLKTTKDTA